MRSPSRRSNTPDGTLRRRLLALLVAGRASPRPRRAAAVASGATDGLVVDLAALVDEHPLRERARALLVDALVATGRVAEALRSYDNLGRGHGIADEQGHRRRPQPRRGHVRRGGLRLRRVIRGNGSWTGLVGAGMTSGHTISIRPTDDHVEVAVDGTVLASTHRALLLDETGLPTRYYLPREDVRMDLLRATTFHTTCPFKGEASYWSVDLVGTTHDGIVWSYEDPIAAAEAIAGHLSFYPDRATLTITPR